MSKRYTSKTDLELLKKRQGGKCGCGALLVNRNDFIIEHSTPLALGGTDTLDNKYLNCIACASLKTYGGSARATTAGTDIGNIWKTKRLRGELKPKKFKRKLQGRRFDKTISRSFSGKVTKRV